METLYAIRDAFFWWAGVWATVTIVNSRLSRVLRECERKRRVAKFMAEIDTWRSEAPSSEREPSDGDASEKSDAVENPHEAS